MPKLSTFTDRTIPVEAHVRGEVIKLSVQPYAWTIDREQHYLSEMHSQDADRMGKATLDFFLSVITWWDITDDDGEPYPLNPDSLHTFPSILLQELLEEAKSAITFRKR